MQHHGLEAAIEKQEIQLISPAKGLSEDYPGAQLQSIWVVCWLLWAETSAVVALQSVPQPDGGRSHFCFTSPFCRGAVSKEEIRNRSIILKILFSLNIQTFSVLELPSSMTIACFHSGYVGSEEMKLCGASYFWLVGLVFFVFPPKVFLIVQFGGLNIQNQPAFWGFHIAVHNL